MVLPAHPSPVHVAILGHRGTSKEGLPGRSLHWERTLRVSEKRRMLRASRGGGCWRHWRGEGCWVCWRGPMPQHNSPAVRAIPSHLPRHLRGSSSHLCCAGSCSKALEAPSLAQGAVAADRTTSLRSSPGPSSPQTSTATHHGTLHPQAWHPATQILCQDPKPPWRRGTPYPCSAGVMLQEPQGCSSPAPVGSQPGAEGLHVAGQAGCGVSVPGMLGLGSQRRKNP